MKKVFIVVFIAWISLLNSINYFSASGQNVTVCRDSLVYYHTNADDQHWYGTDSWAVKFDFNNYFSGIDFIEFQAEGARVYIPGQQSSDSITIKLCKDYWNQPNLDPDSVLFSYTIQPAVMNFQDWNDINFSQTFTDTIFWLVVDYTTNSSTQFISASAVDGAHSYFLDNGYYYNMLANSFESEFLFSLKGKFNTEGTDLDLITLSWVGDMIPAGEVSPVFIVKNNSSETVYNAYINIDFICPEEEIDLTYIATGSVCDSILLPAIPPDQTIEYDISDSLFYQLFERPTQYEVDVELVCVSDSLTQNNSYSDQFNLFIFDKKVFVENAVKANDLNSEDVWNDQYEILHPDSSLVLNYFANFPDEPFFNPYSLERFHYYDLMGFPATILNGTNKILGYYSGYLDEFSSIYYHELNEGKTFVESDTSCAYYNDIGNVEFVVQFEYSQTPLFADFIAGLTFYIAIMENVSGIQGLPSDIDIQAMLYMANEATGLLLNYEEPFGDTINFNMLEDFETISGDTDSCSVVYWLQDNFSKEIFLVNSLPFTEFIPGLVSIDEDDIPTYQQSVQIYPNPYKFSGYLNISLNSSREVQQPTVAIYNIKGQLIKEIKSDDIGYSHTFIWDGRDNNNKKVASGVYLMKFESKTGGTINKQFRKCLLLKQK